MLPIFVLKDNMYDILHYDIHNVSYAIKNHRELMTPFLSEDFSEELFNKYEKFGLNRFNAVYDRTGNLPHYLTIAKGKHPIPPKVYGYNKSFFEVSEQRCKELLSLNKPIQVMWSGGLDSTYILFMLRHFANDKDQVRVYGTYNSIIESGDLFDRRIKNEFIYDITVGRDNRLKYQEDCIFVSGMCGNQLFGPTDNMFATGGTAMFHHTLGTAETIYEPYANNVNPELLEFLDPIIKTSPKKLETIADLRWYCIFNLDWYTALYEHKIMLDPIRANKIQGFFDSEEFQSWAVNTKEPFTKIRGDANTHRWQMRQVLAELFGEFDYAKNKPKKISNFGITNSEWILLLDGYHTVMMG